MNGIFDIYTVIFLVLAVVIGIRLFGVLGRRTGSERPPVDPYSRREAPPRSPTATDKVVPLPRRAPAVTGPEPPREEGMARISTLAPDGSQLAEGLKSLVSADPDFDPKGFLAGARQAYEMIVTAFAEGDRKTLKQLLSREVFDGFNAAIGEREKRGETVEFKFVGVEKADITAATVKAGSAQVTVHFVSSLISATHDKDGKVVDGDPAHVGDVTDIWTFAREVAANDPNWKLIATESVD